MSDLMPTQAVLLAAGLGTRLGDLTRATPKCMLPVAGRPIMEHIVGWLRAFGVEDLHVNLHHLPDAVPDYFGDGARFGVRITYWEETTILGTAGTVARVAPALRDEFFVWYADNLSTCRIDRLWQYHQASSPTATVALFERADPSSSGIAMVADDGRIERFLEKPSGDEVFSRLVNAGILVMTQKAASVIPQMVPCDLSRDVLPALIAGDYPVSGYRLGPDEGLWWADTESDYRGMNEAVRGGALDVVTSPVERT